jgi:hypothetical protein
MNDEHTALGIALDTLQDIKTNAEDAYNEGNVIDPYHLKLYIELTLQKINKIKDKTR